MAASSVSEPVCGRMAVCWPNATWAGTASSVASREKRMGRVLKDGVCPVYGDRYRRVSKISGLARYVVASCDEIPKRNRDTEETARGIEPELLPESPRSKCVAGCRHPRAADL